VLWLAQTDDNLRSLALSPSFLGGPLCSDEEHLTDLNDQLISTLKLVRIKVQVADPNTLGMHPLSDLLYTPLKFGFKVLEIVPKLLQSGDVVMATSLKLVPRDLQGRDVILGIKVILQEVAGSHLKHLVFTFIIII
jgi:hypothetical protein